MYPKVRYWNFLPRMRSLRIYHFSSKICQNESYFGSTNNNWGKLIEMIGKEIYMRTTYRIFVENSPLAWLNDRKKRSNAGYGCPSGQRFRAFVQTLRPTPWIFGLPFCSSQVCIANSTPVLPLLIAKCCVLFDILLPNFALFHSYLDSVPVL